MNPLFLRSLSAGAIALALLSGAISAGAQDAKPEPGLIASFTSGGKTAHAAVPNVALNIVAGAPVSPFLKPGAFTATWEGLLSVDLRGDYQFLAELSGTVKIEANGAVVYEGDGTKSEPSAKVRLNKGTNAFKVSYTSPASGDAFLRVRWIPRGSFPQPIYDGQLSHLPVSGAVADSIAAHVGRGLVFERRCVKCHTLPDPAHGSPELEYDAPTFEGIGSRRGAEWMAKWILDPKAARATARMPKMVHGATGAQDAADMAAFLATLKGTEAAPAKKDSPELVEAGKELSEKLHCSVCHSLPGSEPDPKRPALKHVTRKFPAGYLATFLQKPDEHYAWSRMPNFKLTADEANAVAAYLHSQADAAAADPKADAARGKQLVQNTGCLNCHSLKLENTFKAKPLAELAAANWNQACLAEADDGKAPFFAFSAGDRAALQAFAKADRDSLGRHTPAEYAQRQTAVQQCVNCHGALEGFPRLEHLGSKLRPEWAAKFIAGQVSYKPRNWIETRMPAFPKRAEMLATGMAAMHGYPAKTPAETPVDPAEAKIGQRLVSSDGGFSCIACHAVGQFGATQVFESAGVNLAYSSERLLQPFFVRWLLNPTFIDPQTKMPVYFDQGMSPLSDVHEGSALKQINALWEYVKQGSKMPPPDQPQ